jgi:hypothetical protein
MGAAPRPERVVAALMLEHSFAKQLHQSASRPLDLFESAEEVEEKNNMLC